MRSHVAVVVALAVGCAACTTDSYTPGLSKFAQVSATVGPLVKEEAVKLRHEYRFSYLNRKSTGLFLPTDFVCRPLSYTAMSLGASEQMTLVGTTATGVAVASDKSFWGRLGGLFTSYEIPPPRDAKDFAKDEENILKACEQDNVQSGGVDDYLIDQVGRRVVSNNATGAISGIIEIVGPIVTEVLTVIDEARRADALREFFSDETNVARLKSNTAELKKLFGTMDKYRRLRAMQNIKLAAAELPPTWAAGEIFAAHKDKGKKVVDAADTYDTVFSAQVSSSLEDMEKCIDDLQKIANGEDDIVLIRSAWNMFYSTLHALEGVAKLTDDPDTKKKLQGLIDQLLGKKPRPSEGAG